MIQMDKQTREQYMEVVASLLRDDNIEQFRPLFLAMHPIDQLELYLLLNEEERQFLYPYLSPAPPADPPPPSSLPHQPPSTAPTPAASLAAPSHPPPPPPP